MRNILGLYAIEIAYDFILNLFLILCIPWHASSTPIAYRSHLTANFIGFIGLAKPNFDAHFTPTVEVGWRLAFRQWGKGYATEGARAALAYGFDTLQLPEIVSLWRLFRIPGTLAALELLLNAVVARESVGLAWASVHSWLLSWLLFGLARSVCNLDNIKGLRA